MSNDITKIYQANIADPDIEEKLTKVIFAPGCFDDFEGTQEELDELIEAINAAIASGDFLKNSQPLDEEDFELLAKKRPDLFADIDDSEESDQETEPKFVSPNTRH